jgi:hypothetical protein
MLAIAHDLGLTKGQIRLYFRRYEIPTRSNTDRARPDKAQAIVERIKAEHWDGKKSLHQIAQDMRMPYVSLYWYVKTYEIPVRSRLDSMYRASDGHGFMWKGGRTERDGYVYIKEPNHPNANSAGYVPEHRKVMADFLGRPLRKDEIVHHVNGVKTDNRRENLQVRKNGGEGRHHGYLTVCPNCGHDLLQDGHG